MADILPHYPGDPEPTRTEWASVGAGIGQYYVISGRECWIWLQRRPNY